MGNPEKKFVAIALVLTLLLTATFMASFLTIWRNPQSHILRPEPIRVACIGDSITEGTEYPKDLQALLGKNYTVENFGAGGSTVLLTTIKPYIYRPIFQEAMAFEPEIAIFMLGTNDATPEYFVRIEEFEASYKELIGHFEIFKPQMWIVIPPPIFDDSLGPKSENLVQEVIPRIEQVAADLNIKTINVYPLLIDHPEYFWDGVHPDSPGAAIIAQAVYDALIQEMK